jgi:predicted Zn-dependent protease
MNHRLSAIIVAVLLAAGGILTAIGDPDRDVSMISVGELWSDVFRDADQFGLQLSRVSAHEEMELGLKIATGLERTRTTVPMWEVYVQAVGNSLARHVRRKDIKYEFHVIDSPIKNAFALPGGQIFIYKGLLEAMQSEAELASVLGHEIAHVDARHCIERFQYRLRLRKVGLGDVGELINIARIVMVAGYAQYQELEADSLGLSYALAEGYDPQGGIDLFGRIFRGSTEFARNAAASTPLEVLASLAGGALSEYFQSHPPTPERIRRMTAKAEQYRKRHAGDRVYRGVENFRKRVPRSQQEFSGEHIRM